jgi:hypothetical protein
MLYATLPLNRQTKVMMEEANKTFLISQDQEKRPQTGNITTSKSTKNKD